MQCNSGNFLFYLELWMYIACSLLSFPIPRIWQSLIGSPPFYLLCLPCLQVACLISVLFCLMSVACLMYFSELSCTDWTEWHFSVCLAWAGVWSQYTFGLCWLSDYWTKNSWQWSDLHSCSPSHVPWLCWCFEWLDNIAQPLHCLPNRSRIWITAALAHQSWIPQPPGWQ